MDSNQQAILKTSENALLAKAAAVQAGYYDDPFIAPFVHPPSSSIMTTPSSSTMMSPPPPSRGGGASKRLPHVQPIIKRGTHARVCCIDRTIQSFGKLCIEQHERRLDEMDENGGEDENEQGEGECVMQIVVLGCGKDTVFFRNYEKLTRHSTMTLKFFEVDHPPMISEKATIIESNPTVFENANVNKIEMDVYEVEPSIGVSCTFLGHDLREEGIIEKLKRSGCDPSMPTLFILECVLMYLPDTESRNLLRSISETYKDAYLCFYEPVLGDDAFGSVMEGNLTRAGLATPESSLRQTRHLQDQLDKVVHGAGWAQATACDLWHAYDTIVTAAERQRSNRAEFLDEWEEFVLIMQHYCFLVAATGTMGDKFCEISAKSILGFAPGQSLHEKTKL